MKSSPDDLQTCKDYRVLEEGNVSFLQFQAAIGFPSFLCGIKIN